ncbi:helix-turn-helix domain-containing protein [Actinophytocola sp.]|uniref:PucR family transcriptional regulator n=1 Tax=Actinophytocola sp. TaxID=1872138 RepID=UPI003D6A25CE
MAGELARLQNSESWAGRTRARGPIVELRKYDAQHGTRYVPTLRAWLEAGGDIAQGADRLGVHPNTIRDRLRKMTELTRIDMADTGKRQAMIMALAIDD